MTPTTIATEPTVIPAPAVCPHCDGSGSEPGDESILCLECGGYGYTTVVGDLGPTRSRPKGRPFKFYPGAPVSSLLLWETASKRTLYHVTEFVPDAAFPGRAFAVVKVAGGVRYNVLICSDGHGSSCDCAGRTYEATEKADYRAWERREAERVGKSLGCKHSDATLLLLRAGYFDLPNTEATVSEPNEPVIVDGREFQPAGDLADDVVEVTARPEPPDLPVWVNHGDKVPATRPADPRASEQTPPPVQVVGIGLDAVEFGTPDAVFYTFSTLRPGECWPLPGSLWTLTLHRIETLRGGQALVSLTHGPPF